MKIQDDTADIPDRLLALQERGEVVFLCGAGVSQRVGLPSFAALTQNIYQRLDEDWHGHPAEEEAMEPEGGPPSLDRALFSLSKRLRGPDAASRAHAERRLVAAIEAELQPPVAALTSHADILRLSRDAEMRTRVVTTNFDTLFERASPEAEIASRAGADLPAPLATDFLGVLHLHGRIADAARGLTRTPLVLDSAQFGDAYLRSGWAARYVYDLARAATLVIVGYGADDPPMRYILEVLTSDRERYKDINEIFAFVPCADDDAARARAMAIWDAKGATAIVYNSASAADHDILYRTLTAWADFADDPTAWRRDNAARILELHPDEVGEDDWTRLRWLLGAGDAAQLLGDVNPIPAWAPALGRAGLLEGDDASPALWILRRIEDRVMPAAVLEAVPFSERTIATIEHRLGWRRRDEAPIGETYLQAWRLILQIAKLGHGDRGMRWHRVRRALAVGEASLAIRREVVACLKPSPTIGPPFHWPGLEPQDRNPPLLRDLLRVDFGPRNVGGVADLVAHWPSATLRDLIRSLLTAFEDALEDAAEFSFISPGHDGASRDVRSVARHEQDNLSEGFYPIVRAVTDLWERYAAEEFQGAKALARGWLASPYLLVRRMGLHTLTFQVLFDGDEVREALTNLSESDFWLGDARRETMRLMALRWPDLSKPAQQAVETRIANGMPRDLLDPHAPKEQLASVSDYASFIRLRRIENAGHVLGEAGRDALARIVERHPDWRASEDEQDDFRIWSSGLHSSGPQGDISLLQDAEPENLLVRAQEIAVGDPMGQGEVWRLFCVAEPLRALEGLLAALQRGDDLPGAWQSFFWALAEQEDQAPHAAALEVVERDTFPMHVPHAILDWLLRKRDLVPATSEQVLAIWDRLLVRLRQEAEQITDEIRNDVVFRMLNEAEGKIGTMLLEELDRMRGTESIGEVPESIRARIEQLVAADQALGLLGTAAMMDGLRAMHHLSPDWTEAVLVPCASWDEPVRAMAVWSVLLRERVPSARLYAALKRNMLAAVVHPEIGRSIDGVASWLLLPLLWAQAPVGEVPAVDRMEVRRALAQGDEEVRRSAAFWFVNALEQLGDSREETWRNRIGPLFQQVWPLEPSLRSAETSIHLIRLAVGTGDAFPEAVDVIAPTLAAIEPWDVAIWLDMNGEQSVLFDRHPLAVLNLLDALICENAVPNDLGAMLERLAVADPAIVQNRAFMKLRGWARRRVAPV